MVEDKELLIGLSDGELQALAEAKLAPAAQSRLDELLSANSEGQLSDEEQAELDVLVERIDQLTILKARAQYTVGHQRAEAAGA